MEDAAFPAPFGPVELLPRHDALREVARAFAPEAERLTAPVEQPGVSTALLHSTARELLAAMGREGLLATAVARPADDDDAAGGAAPVDLRGVCVVREELAFRSALADALFAVQGLASYPIALAGDPALRERYLGAARKGEAIGAFALTEPNAGSDVSGIETAALRPPRGEERGYVLEGEKTFISNAGIADFYVVFAKTDPLAGARGLSAFLVDGDTPGLRTEPIDLAAPHPIGRVLLDGVHVSETRRLGKEGEGFRVAMATLDVFRASVGAAACGMAARALAESIEHARTRQQFGHALADLQATQLKLADMATSLDAARGLVYRAATARDQGAPRTTRESSMAKLFATEAAFRIVDQAVQLSGGRGVERGAVVERLAREVRPLRIYEGTSEIQRLIVAREILRGGAHGEAAR